MALAKEDSFQFAGEHDTVAGVICGENRLRTDCERISAARRSV